MTHELKQALSSDIQEILRENVVLASYTSFGIGGPADLYAEPKTIEQLEKLITMAHEQGIPYWVLGGGSNTLFHDKGFRGLVIRPQFKKISVTENEIIAEAGATIAQLIQAAAKSDLSGLEVWVGLPGTVGGAVRGNAGAGGVEVKDFLTSATILNSQEKRIEEWKNGDLKFEYRESTLKDKPHLIVLSATLQFQKKLPATEQRLIMQHTLAKRHASQPKGKSAGCAFKNATSLSPLDHKTITTISAGKLIDECGLKGTRIGGVEISTIHANFLKNLGNGTQQDVMDLIELMKKTVKKEKNIDLHEEIQVVGETGGSLE